MSALFWLVGFFAIVAYHVVKGDVSATFGGLLYVALLVVIAILWAWQIVDQWRARQRINQDKFLREVMAAHKRAREAREATDRA